MTRMVVCAAGFGALPNSTLGQEIAYYPVEPIPMKIEVEISDSPYYVGENFPVTVRIVNPNSFDVFLAGFDFGPLEPHMEISFPRGTIFPEEAKHLQDQEFIDMSLGGTINAYGWSPIRVAAGEYLEHRRLIYIGTKLDMGHWIVMPPGKYRIKISHTRGAVTPTEPRSYPKTDWTWHVVEFRLTMPAGRDRDALEFLRDRAEELERRQRNPEAGFRSARFKLRMYREFLDRFSDTVYEPEIRWRTAKLLADRLQDGTYVEEHPEAVDLFDECLTFCLEKGGAYAEEFVEWDKERGGNNYFDLAIKHERWSLVGKMIEALDGRHPDDEGAKLWRRARVAGLRKSGEAARRILETIVEKFPEDRYAEAAIGRIQDIDRGAWPPKPPDEEQRLYRRAIREATRSPENGRRMLVQLLARFPDGRYRSQIRALIDAIDDGTWPPKGPQAPNADTPP